MRNGANLQYFVFLAPNLNLETCQSTGLLTIEIQVTGHSSGDPKKWTCLVHQQITTCR